MRVRRHTPRRDRPAGSGKWTETEVEALIRLVNEKKSMGEISEALRISRTAVAGRIYRLRQSGQLPEVQEINKRFAKKKKPDLAVDGQVVEATQELVYSGDNGRKAVLTLPTRLGTWFDTARIEFEIHPKTIASGLRLTECRWPMWDDNDKSALKTFCCKPTIGTQSWCEEHSKRAFRPRVPREQPVAKKVEKHNVW